MSEQTELRPQITETTEATSLFDQGSPAEIIGAARMALDACLPYESSSTFAEGMTAVRTALQQLITYVQPVEGGRTIHDDYVDMQTRADGLNDELKQEQRGRGEDFLALNDYIESLARDHAAEQAKLEETAAALRAQLGRVIAESAGVKTQMVIALSARDLDRAEALAERNKAHTEIIAEKDQTLREAREIGMHFETQLGEQGSFFADRIHERDEAIADLLANEAIYVAELDRYFSIYAADSHTVNVDFMSGQRSIATRFLGNQTGEPASEAVDYPLTEQMPVVS